jgi:4-hydroxybenzoate polyprenyltransferase
VVDYKEDRQRHHHWERPVNQENKSLVLTIALSRFVIGTAIAFFLNVKLGYLAIAFLALQFFYDHFAKKFSPLLAIFTVSIVYPLRSLTVFYGLGMGLDKTSILLLLSLLLYSTYMVIQWRKHESLFITKNKLVPKPHSEFFSSSKINFLISLTLLAFLLVFITLIISLIKIDTTGSATIYVISSLLVIIFSLPNKNILYKITAQSRNIIIAFLFIILTFDKYLIGLAITVASVFMIFWYHRIYVERFANNYFNETHYEKT